MTEILVYPLASPPPERVEFAHTLRGLAALSVLISHFLGVFWINPAAVSGLLYVPVLALTMPAYFAPLHFTDHFNYGSLGVAVFFLISGFVIPFSLAGLSWRGFLVARCLRIYPVYFMSLAISLSVIWLFCFLLTDNLFPFSIKHIVAQGLLIRGWLWVPSIDGLSWTLEIEMVFYLVAAAMAPYIVGLKARGRALIVYVLTVPVLCILGVTAVEHLTGFQQKAMLYATFALPFTTFMFAGTFFYLYLRSIIGSAGLVLGLIACMFAFSVSLAAHPSLKTLATSSYFLALLVFSAFFFVRDSFRKNTVLDALADISYPLYAVHAVSGYGIMYILVAKGTAPWLAAVAGFTVAVGLAYVMHRIVEQPTMRFGKFLAKKLFPKDSSTNG